MALTEDSVASAIRAGRSAEELVEVRRILAYATEAIDRHAPDAPEATKDEATIKLCGYVYDMPTISAGASVAHALRNSGAGSMLTPYRVRRAGSTAAGA